MSAAEPTAAELGRRLRAGEVSARQLTEAALARISARDGRLRAFLRTSPERALVAADAADRRLREDPGAAPPLCGVPMAVKDVLCTEGVETTAGSRILEGFVPPYTATAVARLEAAGAICLGKLNCDEFAMGSSTENSAYQTTANPWDLQRVPGGSSGGSAAAVAGGLVPITLGTDTGGSIRQPAALCGTVGFKPTYGRVSRYGLIAFASSLDQVGPLARSVEDAAMAYAAVAGHDPLDATSLPEPVPDPMGTLRGPVRGLRLGVPHEYLAQDLEPGVRAAFDAACVVLTDLGAELVEVHLPHTDLALAAYYVLAPAEASSNLARMDGLRFGPGAPGSRTLREAYQRTRHDGFGPEVRRRVMLGTYALSSGYYDAYYRRAQQVRTLVARDFTQAFATVDAIVSPTSPTVAFPLGARTRDPLAMYACDILTLPCNLAGIPGISVPAGFSEGLPVGLQVLAPAGEDARCLRVAASYEAATSWAATGPPLEEAAV